MKAFRFTLQAVQTIRQQEEQQALEHYALFGIAGVGDAAACHLQH
jgi:hypothetical protein